MRPAQKKTRPKYRYEKYIRETKVSKQQEEILKILYKSNQEGYTHVMSRFVSRKISNHFNKKRERSYKNLKETSILSDSHKASFSRSLKRLEKRNLIERVKQKPDRDEPNIFYSGKYITLKERGVDYGTYHWGKFKPKS